MGNKNNTYGLGVKGTLCFSDRYEIPFYMEAMI